jgi:uncharacterized protein with von Willebrand factor type A (vWA) domain
MSFAESIDKVHEELLQEEGMKVSDLPESIQRKIKGWNLLFARLQKNPDDEKMFRTLQKQSVEIADKIQDFIEQDFDDEGEGEGEGEVDEGANEGANKGVNEGVNKGSNDNSNPSPKSVDVTGTQSNPKNNPERANKGFGNLVMEKKILEVMKQRGSDRISINQLESIIGKEPDYPEQKVHNINLRKVFMASDYRLVK